MPFSPVTPDQPWSWREQRAERRVRLVVRLLVYSVSVGASLGGGGLPRRLAGQTPAVAPATALQGVPTPLVTAGFPAPSHPIDWTRYTHSDECTGIVIRTTATAVYDSVDRTSAIDRARMFDTTFENPWAPLPRGVAAATQACLARFPLTTIPPYEVIELLRLAITVQAEPLISALVAQWIETGQATPAVTAARLDTVVDLLMRSPGVPGQPIAAAPSPAHVALARRYAAQLDALGPAALSMRISAERALDEPGDYTANPDSVLTHSHTEARLARQLSPAQFKAVEWVARDTMELVWRGVDERIRWLTTGAPDALARFVQLAKATQHLPLMHLELLGTTAPPITGDYCFATPSTRVPTTGLTPALPARGAPTLVVFDDDGWPLFAQLRRLHHEFPTLQIVQVLHLQGAYQNRWLAQAPADEARLRRDVLVDSLGVPGSLCFLQQTYQTLPNGELTPLVSPLARAYDLDVEEPGWFLLDPTGAFVDVYGPSRGGNTWRTLLQRWTASSVPSKLVP
jgi:hypothetical protein